MHTDCKIKNIIIILYMTLLNPVKNLDMNYEGLNELVKNSEVSVKLLAENILTELEHMGIMCYETNKSACNKLHQLVILLNRLIRGNKTITNKQAITQINNYFKFVFLDISDIWDKDKKKMDEQIESFSLIIISIIHFFNREYFKEKVIFVSDISIDILEHNSAALDKFKLIYNTIKKNIKTFDRIEDKEIYGHHFPKELKDSRKKKQYKNNLVNKSKNNLVNKSKNNLVNKSSRKKSRNQSSQKKSQKKSSRKKSSRKKSSRKKSQNKSSRKKSQKKSARKKSRKRSIKKSFEKKPQKSKSFFSSIFGGKSKKSFR